MREIKINKYYCKGCQLCINFCPKHALILSNNINEFGYKYAELKPGNNGCTGCGICRIVCPDIAIELKMS